MASFGGSIKLTGADEYRNALKQITQSLRETGSELTAVASRYDANDRSLDTLNKKTSEIKMRKYFLKLNFIIDQFYIGLLSDRPKAKKIENTDFH